MKIIIFELIAIFCLISALWAENIPQVSTTTSDENEARLKLEAFENGSIDLDETSGTSSMNGCQQIIDYYLLHTNEVSVKMKLPISRCFAALNEYPEAIMTATEYVGVYSNDWRGWKILGVSYLATANYHAAVKVLTISARLGDDYSYAPLTFAALKIDRLDVVSNQVQHLLVLKKREPTPEATPLDIVTVLTLYSLKSDQQDVFVKALNGVSAKQIMLRDDLPQLVKTGCERFKGKDIDKISQELETASESSSSSTATNAPQVQH